MPFCRFSVTSRKSSSLRFVCMSILKRMSLKILTIYFIFLSICWPLRLLKGMSPSSRYNPKLVLGSIFSRFPTSLHISAQSKLLMVTSKQLSVDFFFQVRKQKNRKDFLQCMIKRRSLSSMVVNSFANWIIFVKIPSLMDG